MKERTEGRERDRQTDGRTARKKTKVHHSIIVPRVFHLQLPMAEEATGNEVDGTCCYNSKWPEKLMVTYFACSQIVLIYGTICLLFSRIVARRGLTFWSDNEVLYGNDIS